MTGEQADVVLKSVSLGSAFLAGGIATNGALWAGLGKWWDSLRAALWVILLLAVAVVFS